MNRSRKFLAVLSITALVLVVLLGGFVTATAGQNGPEPSQSQSSPSVDKSANPTAPAPSAGLESSTPAVGQDVDTKTPVPATGNGESSDNASGSLVLPDVTQSGTPDSSLECTSNDGQICGTKKKRNDAGGNVAWDGPAVTIWLLKNGQPFHATGVTNPATTDQYGNYCFKNLPYGTYTVKEEIPTGYDCVVPGASGESAAITLSECHKTESNVNFVNKLQPPPPPPSDGSISGHKWHDNNWNGIHETDEPGWGGVTITLLKDGQPFYADGVTNPTVTGSDGSYSFTNLPYGDYTVREDVPYGMINSSPTSVPAALDGQHKNITGIDFLNYCGPGFVEVLVFEDKCDDTGMGQLDGADTLVTMPVTVQLFHVLNGGTLKPADGWDGSYSKTTGAGPSWNPVYPSGAASWINLPTNDGSGQAQYVVKMIPPPGWDAILIPDNTSGTESKIFGLKCPVTCRWQQIKFLLSPTFSISGHKYEDVDGNGKYTLDVDTPVSGVSIELWKDGALFVKDGVTNPVTTGADGSYSFTNLPHGTYTVKEVLTGSWIAVSPPNGVYESVEVGCGDSRTGVDFLNCKKGSVRGHKYEDLNANGQKDSGEPGFKDVTIHLYKAGTTVDAKPPVKTDSNGAYVFSGVDPGTYDVVEVLEAGVKTKTTTIFANVVVASGQETNLDTQEKWFLNYKLGSIQGLKYWDENENGLPDDGDQGLSGITIILTPEQGEPLTTVTDSEGWFSFNNLEPGKYTVSVDETTAEGYYPISVTSINVEIKSGEKKTVYFSEAPFGSISGHKWIDSNANGVWDAEEAVYTKGVTINLYEGTSTEGDPLATQVTGEDGTFAFTNLMPGTYTVVEVGKEGYFATTSNSELIELENGEGAVMDFGNCPYGRIEGIKISDLNGDGAQNDNEPGLAGVEVVLTGIDDPTFVRTTTTGDGGTFVFNELKPGKYFISETMPAGYYATRPIMVEVKVGGGESIKVVFLNAEYASISGNKWIDDGDGVLVRGKDMAYEGLTIRLTGTTKKGEPVNMVTTTGKDGSFAFKLLEAGDYHVEEVFPSTSMKALLPATVDVALKPGDSKEVDFLNTGAEVLSETITPVSSETLPATGMNELPWLIAAGLLMLLGLLLLAAGYRRRLQE
jgi:LPXTG-motif cell wall-anchored protein